MPIPCRPRRLATGILNFKATGERIFPDDSAEICAKMRRFDTFGDFVIPREGLSQNHSIDALVA
jgi:hypothetical protein